MQHLLVAHADPLKPARLDDAVIHLRDGIVHDPEGFLEQGGDDCAENGADDNDLDSDYFGGGAPGAGMNADAALERRQGGTTEAKVRWRRGEAVASEVGRVSVSCSVIPALVI